MRVFIVFLLIFFLGGCAQLTRLDTGRTIGKGNVEVGGFIAAYGVNEAGSPDLGAVAVPFAGIQTNYGIANKVDINASLNTGGNLYLNPKIQLVGDQESSFALSILPGVDFQFINPDLGRGKILMRPHASLIMSLHQNRWALFLEPKYVFQNFSDERTHFIGTTLGYEYSLNNNWKLALGYSHFYNLDPNPFNGSALYNIGFSAKKLISLK